MTSVNSQSSKALLKELLSSKKKASRSINENTPPLIESSSSGTNIPASSTQKQFFFHQQKEPNSTANNLPLLFEISGEIDYKKLQYSIENCVLAHRILRTGFQLIEDKVVQVIAEFPFVSIEKISCEQKPTYEILESYNTPFQVDNPPLFKVVFFENTKGSSYLFLTFHHLIADGLSFPNLIKHITATYTGHTIETANLQFEHFAIWEQCNKGHSYFIKQRKFWAEQQQKFSPIDFSQKHINSDSSSSNSKTHIFRLSNKLVQSLQEYAKKNTLSLYHICFAAYFILLQRLSNQIELTIGTAWSRRKNPALKSMIGPLLNTLAINLSFDISDTFQSVVERCKKAILLAQENGDYPFWDDLIDQGNEIYNTFFDFHYATINEIQLKDVRFVKQEIRNLDSKFPISLECYHNAEELKFEFEYSDQFFDKDFVVKISHQYCKILESFAEQSSITVFTQDLFTETDKKLLYERNYLANHKMIGIEDTFRPSFEKVVSKYSQHIALQDKYSFLTYKKLDEMVNRIAQHLLQLGLGSESRILLFMDRHKEFVIGALACFNLGMPYTPIDPSSIPTRLQSIIDELDPQLVLYHPLSIERLKNLDVSCKQLDIVQMLEAPIARNFAYPCIYPESLAYIIFTSGSTGKPKGVMVQHKGMLNHARAKIVELGLSNRDITAQTSIQTFDVSVWQIICPLLTGGVVSLFRGEEAWSPELLIPVLHQQQVTIFETVPSHMRVLLQYLESVDQQTFFRHLRILILNGEALPYNMCKQWISSYSDIPIVNAYGPTECSDDVTHQWVDDTNIDATLAYAPIGKILPGLAGFVLGHFQEQKPTGILGSLYIAGEGLARGYLDQPGLTASVFLPLPNHIPGKNPGERFYYTGDLVKQLDNGVYYYFGRNDHQVKINGQRIETGEIEKTILTIKGVRDCAIIPQKVSGRSVTLVAYLVLDKNISTLSTDIVKKEAQKLLPVNMVPRYWMSLDQIPITTNGKRNVKELPLPSDDGKTYPKHRAKTPIEQKIASAWEEVLGLDQFGINDDFFEVGGHSLLAAQLAMALSKRLNTSVPLKDIFQFSTIRELAKQYSAKNTEESSAFSEFALIQDKEQRYSPFPVTEVQQAYLLGRQQLYSLGDVSVHIYSEYERGNLDTKKFEESFNQLVQRHEALRIIFPDITTQTILASVPYYKFEIFSYDNEQEATPKLEELRATLSHEVFSADQWPLFKIKIVKFSNTYRIFLSFDALLMDGWSVDILFQEWITLYEKNTSLPPLQLSYRDYVLSMKAARKSKLYTKSRAFWLEKAQTFPSGPNLPIKVNPTQLREQKFQRVVKRIDSDAWGKIQNRIKKMKISPTAFVAELFSSILSSFGNSNHFALNLTLFDRVPIDPEINNICGDFTSLILLEHDYRENPTTAFDSNLLRTQDALWKSLDNRLFDGISFLRELNKNAKQTRFFPVVLTSILGIEDDQDRDIEKFFGKEIYSISQTPQVWLDFKAYEISGQLVVEWDYVKDLFENGFIEHMHGEFCSKIFELSNTADWSKLNTSLLSSSEKKARIDYNQTRASYPTCSLFELFEKQAAKTPNSIAAIDTKKQFTYSQLLDLCQLTIKKLLAQKVSPNQLVAVIIDKQVEQIAATLSIVGAGAAYLPIDPSFPGERIKTLLELGEVSCILTTSKIYNQINEVCPSIKKNKFELIVIDDIPLSDETAKNFESPKIDPKTPAYVIFTSGSTGSPKGVMITHEAVVNTLFDMQERLQLTKQDRVLGLSNLNFDLSVFDIFGLLMTGGTVVLPDNKHLKDPGNWVELICEHKITTWNTAPMFMGMLLKYLEMNPLDSGKIKGQLRNILLSGDWIPVDYPKKIYEQLCSTKDPMNFYSLGGATEASIWSICYRIKPNEVFPKSIPYGFPMKNQSFYVLDDEGRDVPTNVPGNLYIGGTGLFLGYWKDETKTRSSFLDHPRYGRLYKTGDRGKFTSKGYIEFLGRIDNQVKLHGYRVELGEIESALREHKDVAEVKVIPIKQEKAIDSLVAYVQPMLDDISADEPPLLDPSERLDFKLKNRMKIPQGQQSVQLKRCMDQSEKESLFFSRKSYRQFTNSSISKESIEHWIKDSIQECGTSKDGLSFNFEALSSVLELISSVKMPQMPFPKYLYPSAGTTYPIAVFLEIPVEIDPLDPGLYTYHPNKHSLEKISEQFSSNDGNLRITFAADIGSIQPLYGSQSQAFCELEVGYMLEVMQKEFAKYSLGLSNSVLAKSVVPNLNSLATYEITPFANFKRSALTPLLYIRKSDNLGFDAGWYQISRSKNEYSLIENSQTFDVSPSTDINYTIFNDCVGALFFLNEQVSQSDRIAVGALSQSLMQNGVSKTIGACPIGMLDERGNENLRKMFGTKQFIHCLFFGKITEAQVAQKSDSKIREGLFDEALKDHLQSQLPAYMLPDQFVFIEKFPQSSNGKVDIKKLPKPTTQIPRARVTLAGNGTESELLQIWSSVLEIPIEDIGVETSFFELGGNSLTLVELHSLLQKKYGDIPIDVLFKFPTIRATAHHLQSKSEKVSTHQAKSKAILQKQRIESQRNRKRRNG